MKRRPLLAGSLVLLIALVYGHLWQSTHPATPRPLPIIDPPVTDTNSIAQITHSDAEWKKLLTPEQYNVLREKDTELAFHGAYYKNHVPGLYQCSGCGLVLFLSEAKFDSGTGWPSFFRPIAGNRLVLKVDGSFSMPRTEVLCARCGSHLGHVFDDGPPPTGKRYCMNSIALLFVPKE